MAVTTSFISQFAFPWLIVSSMPVTLGKPRT